MFYLQKFAKGVAGFFKQRSFYLCGLFLLSLTLLFGRQAINLEKVEGEGLTNHYIKCITQDKTGFLWVGTEEGLFRYDGYKFEAVRNFPGDTNTLSNNNIEYLWPEANGSLWIGSRGGLSCIDNKNLLVKNFPAEQAFSVYSLVVENDTTFYIGTSIGLFEFFKKTGAWKPAIGFPINIFIRSLTLDGKGNLFVTSHQGLFEYNINSKTCRHFNLPLVPGQKGRSLQIAHRSILGKDGNVWITTWNAGLLQFETATQKLVTFLTTNPDKTIGQYSTGYDIFQNSDGSIWLANSEKGITLLDPRRHTSTSYRIQWDEEKQIYDRVYAVFTDKSGINWVGTENGIYKNDPHRVHFTTINFMPVKNKKAFRRDFSPVCTVKDKDGDWWMGSYDGLFLFDPLTGNIQDYSSEAGMPGVTSIFNLLQDSTGNTWLTAGNRLICLEKKRLKSGLSFINKTYGFSSIQSTIICEYIDRQKRVWLGTSRNGVFMFDPATKSFTSYPCTDASMPVNKNEIRSFYELPDESLLIGGEGTGLVRLIPSKHKYERIACLTKMKGAINFTVNAIVRDDNSNLWIGTEGNGLLQTDEHFRNLQQYTIRDGLPSMKVTALMSAGDDHLWILSEGGVIDFRPLHKKLTLFDKDAGIRNLYNLYFISKMEKGTVAIGDMGCLHLYNPSGTSDNLLPPDVTITGFKVFDNAYPFSDNGSIELNYDQNYFSFEYVGLNYTKSSHNMYAFMLEGVDTKWNDAGTRRYVSYANLQEGTYTFKVKASNSEGVWNEVPATLHLLIRPPYWHRWWFYSLMILSAGFLACLIYIIKRRQLQSKERLRNKIARDLHDDIGSTLSGINIFSKIALQKLHSDQHASGELLQRINNRTEKTMEALSDIVWSINTKKDNMDNVLSRMREYLGEIIEPQGIQYEFLIEEGINNVHIDMEIRKEVYLIFKEAIHNASKYAACSFISIKLKKENRSVLLLVKDNGKGFEIRSIVPGNGINNMQERAKKIRASFEISSDTKNGTSIRLLFPIT